LSPILEVRQGVRFNYPDSCPCCGSTDLAGVLNDGADFETGFGHFKVSECRTCGIQFTVPQPLPEDVALLYLDRTSHDFDVATSFVSRLRTYNNLRQLKRLPSHLRDRDAVCLDYGCGSGFFTQSMRTYMSGRIIGSDFHASAPPLLASRSDIEYLRDDDLDSMEGCLDLVVCRNVLEHTIDPLAFLARQRRLLKPNGFALVEVPNRRSTWSRLLGRNYFNYYLPRHLYHYDASTLASHLVGFTVVGQWFDHSPILGKSFASMFGTQISGFALMGLALLPLQALVDAAPGRSSQLVVLAQRT